MKVLLVGSGGREHALAWKLARSPRLAKLYSAPGSAAMASLAEPSGLDASDAEALARFCSGKAIGLVVIGPEGPLAAGLADTLGAAGIPVFGPTRSAARLESSKSFAKDFMRRHGIPTARAESFADPERAKRALKDFSGGVVVKADGLAAGKGVRVCSGADEAAETIDAYMKRGELGAAGRVVLLEERLAGREVSFMGLCDGKTFLALPPSSDHKRLRDGDLGPNTGGMGVIAPTPEATPELLRRARAEVADRVLAGLAADGIDYCGLLYCGLMLTEQGPKTLEFNARFGDPETQAVLPLVNSDLLELLEASVGGTLGRKRLEAGGAAATVVLASEGYPSRPLLGRRIFGIREAEALPQTLVFHSGTARDGDGWKTAGGRVLAITGLGEDPAAARERAYRAAETIRFEGLQYRRDIGLTPASAGRAP